MGEPLLQIKGVQKHFGGFTALAGVNLDIAPGERFGLIGPNGSGKTTLINVITGLLPATSGRVAIDSTDLSGLPAHKVARAGIARTFQSVRLFRSLTVSENVVVAGIGGNASRADALTRAGELLAEFGLERYANTLSGTLPYGLERKLELARALATRPTFLLLDEPAAGLDEGESDTLLELLDGIPAKHGCGVVVVDHDMRLIMRLCDRLHVLASGKTIAQGNAEEVRRDPRVIAAYLGSQEAAA